MRPGARPGAKVGPATSLAVAAALAGALGGCADVAPTRDVRATIVDEQGAPIRGALFYAEVRDEDGPFAFVASVAGNAGEVPESAYEPLKLPWRRGARVVFAAFAPDRRPAVRRFATDHPRTEGVLLTLPRSASAWNEELAALAFPFENAPELAARLREDDHAALRDAFREAWSARPPEPPPSDADLRKMAILGLP